MTVLLHGFWGQPADWNPVFERLPLSVAVTAPDLYLSAELSPAFELNRWHEKFWHWVDGLYGAGPIQLVGYSMGARLAVAAATVRPERVSRALFLSGNPVFRSQESQDREKWEQEWSKSFLQRDWNELELSWQDQAVFASTPAPIRRKVPEMREALGLSLSNWSPRRHPFALADIQALPPACEWAFGASDQNYLRVAKTLQELPVQGQISIIPQAGHRLITEAADFVSQWIAKGH